MVENVQGFNTFMTKRLPDAIRKAAHKSLDKSGQQLVYGLQAVAPYESGELQTAISYRLTDTYEAVSMTLVGGDNKTIEGSKQVARLQEFGTVDMPANPWFFPLYRRRRRSVQSALNRAIKKAIKDAAGNAS